MTKNILQLGTVNWQIPDEPSSGSGILHQAHHKALLKLGIKSFSIFPTKVKRPDHPLVKPFCINHDIPIFTRIPTSSYRFSDMSEIEFNTYVESLKSHTKDYIDEIEYTAGPIDAAIAHHAFINPLILNNINNQRRGEGKGPIPVFVLSHGTALKLLEKEMDEGKTRFLPLVRDAIMKVKGVFAISTDQVEQFSRIFPDYPKERVILTSNGIDPQTFKPMPEIKREEILAELAINICPDFVVTFVGKFAEWKRLDLVLKAAAGYEVELEKQGKKACTLIVGTGSEDQVAHYKEVAKALSLKRTYFVGPKGHRDLANIYNITDIGVFPSHNEPFGLVFLECMACGTPVIGANSGGPKDFVTDEVGRLIEEADNKFMVEDLNRTIITACLENWKKTKGKTAHQLVTSRYTWENQIKEMLAVMKRLA